MDLELEPDAERRAVVAALLDLVPQSGWRRSTLEAAGRQGLGDPNAWRRVFPRGVRDGIWRVSDISDASMRAAFDAVPANAMSEVIAERFAQNAGLKHFVRQVMAFDVVHPLQALARMQRTARVMFACLGPGVRPPSACELAILNLAYTATVFVWLFDWSDGGKRTVAFTRGAMRLIGLS
jgi:hypothetical protein